MYRRHNKFRLVTDRSSSKYYALKYTHDLGQQFQLSQISISHACWLNIMLCDIFFAHCFSLFVLHFRTIKEMVSSLTREDERTNLAEVSSWSPVEQPEILFMLYDVGGQESYKNTTHIFQVCTASQFKIQSKIFYSKMT